MFPILNKRALKSKTYTSNCYLHVHVYTSMNALRFAQAKAVHRDGERKRNCWTKMLSFVENCLKA